MENIKRPYYENCGKLFIAVFGYNFLDGELFTPREIKVLKMRFGLDDGVRHTFDEVAQEFCLTRARIRQIQTKAFKKLRKY
jgi:DNA-directed RNA polymerase sigma subunit (sigma70/sigma32)